MIGEEILQEIDQTLDQLIENASLIDSNTEKLLDEAEKEGFQKMQESLLAHLLHMDEKLAEKRASLKKVQKKSSQYKIQEKLLHLENLQSQRSDTVQTKLRVVKKTPRVRLRKSRRKKALNTPEAVS